MFTQFWAHRFPAPDVSVHKTKATKESAEDLPVHSGPDENGLNVGQGGRAAKTAALGWLRRVGLAPCARKQHVSQTDSKHF